MNENYKARLALLPTLAETAPSGHIGRTALMKYMYFLQTLRGVPLGYQFSMYSYGPFDSDVLADLSAAEASHIVDVTTVEFPGGYGYRIRPGSRAGEAKNNAYQFLEAHRDDVEWLFESFGSFNSAELELAGTIVYVDLELAESGLTGTLDELLSRVKEIKPHFTSDQIQAFTDALLTKGVLSSSVHGSRSAAN
jgi:hypothetical protein